ncbi:MAG TPA: tRNA-(ms[2]io[6]A)-hydroxylase [Candidatus Binatia bacterium]|nr:tRNA-(ms[2]io[6]A)-hydroxylase [Candidatus Binatia bacterium]
MLHLASSTGPAWLARALTHIDDVLVDHAHCEKKAASTAVSMLFRYPERAELLGPLARLARDELQHFEQVVEILMARAIPLRRQRPSPYAADLLAAVRPTEPERLLDTLLCMALIEARSCERLQLLADAVADADLASLFGGLLASEARHHRTYVDLAERVATPEAVRVRLEELARHEAAAIERAPAWPRLHT